MAEEFHLVGTHHLGSDAFGDRMSPGERTALEMMVSADMIGKVRPFISASLDGTASRAARILARTARSLVRGVRGENT